jgi:hypothetical protein
LLYAALDQQGFAFVFRFVAAFLAFVAAHIVGFVLLKMVENKRTKVLDRPSVLRYYADHERE